MYEKLYVKYPRFTNRALNNIKKALLGVRAMKLELTSLIVHF